MTRVPQSGRFRRTGALGGFTGSETYACMSLENEPRLRSSMVFREENPAGNDADSVEDKYRI